jgi:hypothetical protein
VAMANLTTLQANPSQQCLHHWAWFLWYT